MQDEQLQIRECQALWTKQEARVDNIFYASFWDI